MIHLAAIVGGIANFHKLPHTLLEVNNGLYNARLPRGARRERRAPRLRVARRWCSSARPSSRRPRSTCRDCPAPRSAYGFSKLAGEVYCRALHDEHGLPYTICRPFNAYGPGEMPDDEPGIAHAVPDLIRKALSGQRPLPIFGSGEQTRTLTHVDDIADGIVTAMAHPAGENEDFNISASDELTVAEIAADHLGGVRQRPGGVRARAPAELRGRRAAPLAVGREGASGCSAGRRGSAWARGSPRRSAGCGTRRGWPADGCEARARSPASPARTAPTSPSCCSRRATRCTAWCAAPRPRRSSGSSTSATT